MKANREDEVNNKGERNERVSLKFVKAFYANARSLASRQKREELITYVEEENPDIIGLTETWAKRDMDDSEFAIKNYVLFRKDRENQTCQGHGSGGVMLYVKSTLNAKLRKDIDNDYFKESVWCEIMNKKERLLVGICYRPPNADKEMDLGLRGLMETICKDTFILMGDFNYHIDWHKQVGERQQDKEFLELMENNHLIQVVDKPTRGENTLDLVITSEDHLIENVDVGEHFLTSDHQIVRFKILFEQGADRVQKSRRYNFFKANYEKVREKIKDFNLNKQVELLEVEESWKTFLNIIKQIQEEMIPLRQICRDKRPWVTREVRSKRKAKNKAWRKLQFYRKQSLDNPESEDTNSRLKQLLENYKNRRRESLHVNKNAMWTFEKNLADNIKRDSKSFYSYVRNKQKRKDRVGPLKNEKDRIVESDAEATELLNNYFGSVFTNEKEENTPVANRNPRWSVFGMEFRITEQEVVYELGQLKEDKSPGIDGLHPKFLKEVRMEISQALTIIYNNSLSSGKIPPDWKDAVVVPLFKKGDRSEPCNYRPVSLTSIVCKMLERIIKRRIIEHLAKNNIIGKSQHGFVNKRSCLTNLLEFFEEVYTNLDKGKAVDVVYLDFAKAFDKVPHKRLRVKLEEAAIGGNLLEWITNWLTQRRQKVGIRGNYSNWVDVTSGVPQGSVLGPLLFTIFINDIDSGISSKIIKFADDTKLCAVVDKNEDVERMQTDLEKLLQWAEDWQMKFNTDKCAVIHMGAKNKQSVLQFGDRPLKDSLEERDLGIIVDKSGSPTRQCIEAAKRANSTLGMIKRTIVNRDKSIMLNLYKTLVRPKLEYCIQAWSPYWQKDKDVLERVQRRATRMINNCKGLSYEERLKKCGLTTLDKRRTRGDLIQAFKIITGKDEIDSSIFFKLAECRNTRGHQYKLFKERVGTIKGRFFSSRVIEHWNKLDKNTVEASTTQEFKVRLGRLGF